MELIKTPNKKSFSQLAYRPIDLSRDAQGFDKPFVDRVDNSFIANENHMLNNQSLCVASVVIGSNQNNLNQKSYNQVVIGNDQSYRGFYAPDATNRVTNCVRWS